jgi:hypothetical protein
MIGTREEYNNFLIRNNSDDLFLHVVLLDDREHPCTSSPSAIFFQNFRTSEIYNVVIDHQDNPIIITIPELIRDISKFNGRLFVLDKKSFIQHLPLKNVIDINLGLHLKNEKTINLIEFENDAQRFIRQNYYTYPLLNKVVPLVKHQEQMTDVFSKINNVYKSLIFNEKYFLKINNIIIEPLSELEGNGIYVDVNKFKKRFNATVDKNGFVFSQYNLLTSTGRPSNRFGGVNYAALNRDDGSRECFISRFREEGIMFMVDYSAFHPRIICELTNFKYPIESDFYRDMAKLCFKKNEVDFQDVVDVKQLMFRQLYGGVEELYSHIQFFYNLKGFIDSHWREFNERGYTTTPVFGRKIKEVQEPNPSKVFNYILQATETEIAVPILGQVNEFLRSRKSKAVLYTYDSILFDVHRNELELIKTDLVEIMKNHNRFPVKCYLGKSYADLKQISL